MPYEQDLTGCFTADIGDGGLPEEIFESLLAETAGGLDRLRQDYESNALALLHLPAKRDDIDHFGGFADRFRSSFKDVIILGTGGSSLGGRTLYALADRGFGPPAGHPRLHFLDNVDPDRFAALFAALDLAQTGVIAISKSGSTAETLTQLAVIVGEMRKSMDDRAIGERFVAVTEPKDSILSAIAERFGMVRLDHDPNVGGRFSVLSVVGMLPALIAGLDVRAIREGAATVLDPILSGGTPSRSAPAEGAAVSIGLAQACGTATSVIMPYSDRLGDFGLWYCQLWAESLGKDGHGTTPVRAIGTVDQHSQLQLYLDGPADKMFSLMLTDCAGTGPAVATDFAGMDGLSYLSGRTIGDLLDAAGRATAETLMENGRPTRVFQVPVVDERSMGALMMHYMLETIIAAHLLKVDPFDQPAVEQGKILMREYLAGDAS